jgi:sodium/potassium-transporting ATPase subunit beta
MNEPEPIVKRRNTIAEDAEEGLLEATKSTEDLRKPKKKTFGQKVIGLRDEMYNKEYREFLSRDAKAWCKLSFFYCIFYACLSGFFILYLYIFYQTIDLKKPTYYNKDSVMNYKKINPGLGFRPHLDVEGELVEATPDKNEDNIKSLELFFKNYDLNKNKTFKGAQANQVSFNYEEIIENTSCSKENKYGYNGSSPCVIVKLNKIFGWLPLYSSSVQVPSTKNLTKIDTNDKFILIKCDGENGDDRDNIGEIEYYSSYPNNEIGGINFKYFPYRNQENYLSPLVFVHFKNATKNVLINVECKAYAANIDNTDKINKRGMVHFKLFVS